MSIIELQSVARICRNARRFHSDKYASLRSVRRWALLGLRAFRRAA